ncbi:DUF362 domain-containing protein [Diplocloster agilis]|uniref:DUF362 domain-containing protein n=1 Tax=Diplocloster agilis TaxID=2850323 RepID=UPI00082131FC|nr:DUF362 domain-containing protein [Suonthocola fibrivorans]MCU6732119.1 DUF362 domain-containing protein [Suonthocola fibrivorans]SCI34069.1 Domain of uncharacterised function (DUF362) [uncultured Clostridium sp.]
MKNKWTGPRQICIILLFSVLLCSGCGQKTGNGIPEAPSGTKDVSQAASSPSPQTPVPTVSPAPASGSADAAVAEPNADAPFDGSTVCIVKSNKELASEITAEEIEDMVRSVTPDLDTIVRNGQTVVLKPNLVQMKVDSTGDLLDREVNGITTDWRVANAIVKRVRELNPDGKVYIMEGSASGPTSQVMEYYHYTPEYIKGVDDFISLEEDCGEWQDFDAPEVIKVDLPEGLLHQTYYFNRILYEADVLISIPCLKTSSGVVVTAGIKNVSLGTPPGNLYGAAPDNPSKVKMVSHKIVDGELDQWIYDYYCAKPIDYVIVDGLQGFQSGPVPMSQERKETDKMNMGVILGGSDAVAVDNICALCVGWDPQSVGYLNLFRENKGLGYLENIRVKGTFVDDLRKYFTIKRPELGGVQITDDQGPALSAEIISQDDSRLELSCHTDQDAYKLELYVDDYFYSSSLAEQDNTITLDISSFTSGSHTLRVIMYDRFLNRTEQSLELIIN